MVLHVPKEKFSQFRAANQVYRISSDELDEYRGSFEQHVMRAYPFPEDVKPYEWKQGFMIAAITVPSGERFCLEKASTGGVVFIPEGTPGELERTIAKTLFDTWFEETEQAIEGLRNAANSSYAQSTI